MSIIFYSISIAFAFISAIVPGHWNRSSIRKGKNATPSKQAQNTDEPAECVQPTIMARIMKCFSVSDNWTFIFSNRDKRNSLSIIAGIRYVRTYIFNIFNL